MAKDVYYFKHDAGAGRDMKMLKLKAIHGHFGVGVFWEVVETLRGESNYCWENSQNGYDFLAKIIGCDSVKLTNIIQDCLRVELFHKKDNNFYSKRLERDMRVYKSKTKNPTKRKRNASETGTKNAKESKENKESIGDAFPSLLEFCDYAKSKSSDYELFKKALFLKYEAWKEAGWVDGNGKKIKNWKTTLLNTIPHLKREKHNTEGFYDHSRVE